MNGHQKPARKKPARKKSAGKNTNTKSAGAKKTRRAKDPRKAINVRAIIDALEQHVLGEKRMTATQVGAALALLKKTLPDMQAQGPADTEARKDTRAHEDALRDLE